MSLAESDRHEYWVRIGELRFRCRFHRLFVKYCRHHQSSGSVTGTSHDPLGVNLLCFGPVAMDFSGRQRSSGQDIFRVMLRAAKQGFLSEDLFFCITSLVEKT